MIVIIAGLPGTGKSTLARVLAQRLPGAVLEKDSIRASLFPPAYVEYSPSQDDFCGEIMLQTAGICCPNIPNCTFCWMAAPSRGDTSGSV